MLSDGTQVGRTAELAPCQTKLPLYCAAHSPSCLCYAEATSSSDNRKWPTQAGTISEALHSGSQASDGMQAQYGATSSTLVNSADSESEVEYGWMRELDR